MAANNGRSSRDPSFSSADLLPLDNATGRAGMNVPPAAQSVKYSGATTGRRQGQFKYTQIRKGDSQIEGEGSRKRS